MALERIDRVSWLLPKNKNRIRDKISLPPSHVASPRSLHSITPPKQALKNAGVDEVVLAINYQPQVRFCGREERATLQGKKNEEKTRGNRGPLSFAHSLPANCLFLACSLLLFSPHFLPHSVRRRLQEPAGARIEQGTTGRGRRAFFFAVQSLSPRLLWLCLEGRERALVKFSTLTSPHPFPLPLFKKKKKLNLLLLSKVMMDFLKEWEAKLHIKITCSQEDEPMGTAGPLGLARAILAPNGDGSDDPFFVLNSDVICDFPLKEMLEFHRAKKAEATVLVTKVEDPSKYGAFEGGKGGGGEKKKNEKKKKRERRA